MVFGLCTSLSRGVYLTAASRGNSGSVARTRVGRGVYFYANRIEFNSVKDLNGPAEGPKNSSTRKMKISSGIGGVVSGKLSPSSGNWGAMGGCECVQRKVR